MASLPSVAPRSAKSRLRRNAVVAVLIVAAVAVWYFVGGGAGAVHRNGPTDVVSGIVTLLGQNTGYQDYSFSAPGGSSGVALTGTFTVQGGAPNAVYVLVMNSTTFSSWAAGTYYTPSTWDQSAIFYNSGAETTGSFDVTLPAGVPLVLVFYNPQLNNNVVVADASLTYSG